MAETKKGSAREALKNPGVLTKAQLCAVLDQLGLARPSKTATKKVLVECFRKNAKIIEERQEDVSTILAKKRGRARGRQRSADAKKPHAKRKEILREEDPRKRSKLAEPHQSSTKEPEDETRSKAKRLHAEKEKAHEEASKMVAAQSRPARGPSVEEEPRRRPIRRTQLLQASTGRQSLSHSKAPKSTRGESNGAKAGEEKEQKKAGEEKAAPEEKAAHRRKELKTSIAENWSLIYIVTAISLVLWFMGYMCVLIDRDQKAGKQASGSEHGLAGQKIKDGFGPMEEKAQQVKEKGRVGGKNEAREERAVKKLESEEDRADERRRAEQELRARKERESGKKEQEKKEAERKQLEVVRKRQEDERRRVVKEKAREKETAEREKARPRAAERQVPEGKKQRTVFTILRTVFTILKTLFYVLSASFIILSLAIYLLHKRYVRQKKISEYTNYTISQLKKKARCSLPPDTITELREEFRGLSRSEWNAVTRGIRLDSNIRETTLLRDTREEKAWEWYGP